MTPLPPSASAPATSLRRRWMRTLADADAIGLEVAWQCLEATPEVEMIRGPEAGLVMVRGRIDATGPRFNLGEATVTRATVRLFGDPLIEDVLGSAYVLGTDLEHARYAAMFDGLAQDPVQREFVLDNVIVPLEAEQAARDAAARTKARSTLVDFFTVAREHA